MRCDVYVGVLVAVAEAVGVEVAVGLFVTAVAVGVEVAVGLFVTAAAAAYSTR